MCSDFPAVQLTTVTTMLHIAVELANARAEYIAGLGRILSQSPQRTSLAITLCSDDF